MRGCALVTGASRGIGRCIAVALSQAGWPVAVNYRSDDAGAKQTLDLLDQGVLAPGDVSDPAQIDSIFAAAEQLGPVAVLVNNAGMTKDGLLVLMKPRDWDAVLRTNLDSAYLMSRKAVRGMLSRRWGRIVNITSVVGATRGNAGQANYAAAKAGLVGLTKSLAREVASRNITVNAVAPGLVLTAMTEDLAGEHLRALVDQTPMGRPVTGEEVAAAVTFLASEGAAGITGQTLCVDGGLSA